MKLHGARQRAAIIRLAGMRNHSSRLVDDDQRFVFVDHFERQILRRQRLIGGFRQSDRKDVVYPQPPAGFHRQSIDQDGLLFDRLLEQGPAVIGIQPGQVMIE